MTPVLILAGLVLLAAGIAFAVYDNRRRRQREIAAMSPEQREVYEAEKEYQAAARHAERNLQDATRSYENRVKSAEKALQRAQGQGQSSLGSYTGRKGSVKLWEDRIETPQGVFFFSQGPVRASVEAIGDVTVVGDKKQDSRELYLRVAGPTFAIVVECNPDHGPRVREFAARIENASLSADRVSVAREQSIAAAQSELDTARSSRGEVADAEQQLAAVTGDTRRLDAARQALVQSPTPAALPAVRHGRAPRAIAVGAITTGVLCSCLGVAAAFMADDG